MPAEPRIIPLCEPYLGGNEGRYLQDCIESGWVSSVGAFVDRFESMMAEAVGTAHAVATVNGTASLHIALLVAGVKPGDAVLVSNLTFVASANAIRHAGAFPIFIDADERTWQMDPGLVGDFLDTRIDSTSGNPVDRETGRRVGAILPVHILGYPCEMARLRSLAEPHEIPVIEDATESLGSSIDGSPCGSLGEFGCFSFNGNKLLTTGGGGMIVTKDPENARLAKHLTTQAKLPGVEFIHDQVGYNYRLTNLQAAVGCAQLENLPHHLERKQQIFKTYRQAFDGLGESIEVGPEVGPTSAPCHWLSALRLPETRDDSESPRSRALLQHLEAHGIQSRPLWQPMHLSPAYRETNSSAYPVSETLYREVLCLPSSVGLTKADQETVIERCLEFLDTRP